MNELFKTAEEKMNKSVAALEKEYGSIRAGRANPAILDRVTVDYYGTPTPIIPTIPFIQKAGCWRAEVKSLYGNGRSITTRTTAVALTLKAARN